MAKENLTKQADINITIREVDFVTRFAQNWNALRTIMGIMRPIRKTPGTRLVSYNASIDLESGDIGEGEEIPYSLAHVEEVAYGDIKIEKYAKAVSIEAVNKYGARNAVQRTDDAFLNELQLKVLTRFYKFLNTGTLTSAVPTWQMALAMAKGNVIDKFNKMRRTVTEIVGFANVLDVYEYIGAANITVQTAFGLTYIENFLGYRTLFLLSEPDIERGKVIALPVENIDLYYIDPGDSEFATLGLSYTTDGETNLIGFHADGDYKHAVGESFALMGMTLWAEYLDGIAVVSVDDTFLKDLTLSGESGATTIYGSSVSDLQSNVSVSNGKVTGTLKYLDTPGEIVDYWGPGYFFAFKISGEDSNTTSTLVGLEPSEGTGLVEIHGDNEMNGIAKITDPETQKFKVIQTDNAGHRNIQYYDLSGLTLEEV